MSEIYNNFREHGLQLQDERTLVKLEKIIRKKIVDNGFKISLDCAAEEGLSFTHANYSIIANSIIAYPLSRRASYKYITDVLLDTSNSYPYTLPKGEDKYSQELGCKIPRDLETLVILPGSNILKQVVDRNVLVKLSSTPGVYLKMHPITEDSTKEELISMFGEDRIISRESGLYNLFYKASTIWTTSASESLLYAIESGKKLNLLDIDAGHNQVSGYGFLTNSLSCVTDENKKELLHRILYSPISCVFNAEDPMVEVKIDNYFSYLNKKREYYRDNLV
jgi:hypothetical protein